MNPEQIYLLFGKAWDEYYFDRTPWKNISESTKQEWIDILVVYEKHRDIYLVENFLP